MHLFITFLQFMCSVIYYSSVKEHSLSCVKPHPAKTSSLWDMSMVMTSHVKGRQIGWTFFSEMKRRKYKMYKELTVTLTIKQRTACRLCVIFYISLSAFERKEINPRGSVRDYLTIDGDLWFIRIFSRFYRSKFSDYKDSEWGFHPYWNTAVFGTN